MQVVANILQLGINCTAGRLQDATDIMLMDDSFSSIVVGAMLCQHTSIGFLAPPSTVPMC